MKHYILAQFFFTKSRKDLRVSSGWRSGSKDILSILVREDQVKDEIDYRWFQSRNVETLNL